MEHAAISTAISLLQGKLYSLTDTVSPDTTSWADVAKFAQTTDLANEIIARLEEK